MSKVNGFIYGVNIMGGVPWLISSYFFLSTHEIVLLAHFTIKISKKNQKTKKPQIPKDLIITS